MAIGFAGVFVRVLLSPVSFGGIVFFGVGLTAGFAFEPAGALGFTVPVFVVLGVVVPPGAAFLRAAPESGLAALLPAPGALLFLTGAAGCTVCSRFKVNWLALTVFLDRGGVLRVLDLSSPGFGPLAAVVVDVRLFVALPAVPTVFDAADFCFRPPDFVPAPALGFCFRVSVAAASDGAVPALVLVVFRGSVAPRCVPWLVEGELAWVFFTRDTGVPGADAASALAAFRRLSVEGLALPDGIAVSSGCVTSAFTRSRVRRFAGWLP